MHPQQGPSALSLIQSRRRNVNQALKNLKMQEKHHKNSQRQELHTLPCTTAG